jgi:hypothetical protein
MAANPTDQAQCYAMAENESFPFRKANMGNRLSVNEDDAKILTVPWIPFQCIVPGQVSPSKDALAEG